jgi:hypothetical protein
VTRTHDHQAAACATATPETETAASALIAALEYAWTAIRARHPEVPEVIVILGAGSEARRGLFKLGHFAAARWHVNGQRRAEVLVSGEGLQRGPRDVLATLLHEAAHGLASTRGLQDTSRQGRYHNRRYAHLAAELGLAVACDKATGWSQTTIPAQLAAVYAAELADLAAALNLWRYAEQQLPTSTGSRNLLACQCPCGRKLRVATKTLTQAPILCGACQEAFEPEIDNLRSNARPWEQLPGPGQVLCQSPRSPTMSARPVAHHQQDHLDPAIELASGLTAAGMFAYGVALSYQVLHAIAAAAGLPAWAARLWPLGFEAFMASAALNALAEQRHRRQLCPWQRRVPWYPWTLTGLTAGASILLNWMHPAIPLDPPPEWLVSLVYGLPPLAAVFAWHLFLQRLSHRHQQHPEPAGQDGAVPLDINQDPGQDAASSEPREVVRALLAGETSAQPVTGAQVQAATGLSRSRAYAVLRELRAETSPGNGQAPDQGRDGAHSGVDVAAS